MIKIGIKRKVAVAALLASTTAHAELSIPHTFVAGEPAKAVEVNENFSAIVEAANSVRVLKVSDEDGEVGQLLSSSGDAVTVVTDKSYVLTIRYESDITPARYVVEGALNGDSDSLYYESADCTGTAYRRPFAAGSVFSLSDSAQEIYFIDNQAVATEITALSRMRSSCTMLSASEQIRGFPISENDESVTGFDGAINGLLRFVP